MTNLVEINALCISSGGVGGHYTALSALNELCTLQGVTAGHFTNLSALNALAVGLGAAGGYVTNLQALNAISVAIGGTGGYNTALAAWTEIVGIGFNPYDFVTDPDFVSNLKGLKVSGAFTYMEDIIGTNDAKLTDSLCTDFATGGVISTTNATIKDNLRHMDGMVTTLEFTMKCDAVVPTWTDYSYNTIIGCGGYSTGKRGFIVGFAPNPGATANRFKVTVASDTNVRTVTFATDIDLLWHKYEIIINTTALTIDLKIDGAATETQNIPTGGTTWQTNAADMPGTMVVGRYGGVLGTSGNCADVSMARVRMLRDATVTFDLPLSQCSKANYQPFDRVTGTRMTSMSNTTPAYQDYYHVNLGLDFELYDETGVSTLKFYLPYKTDGTPIAATITDFARVNAAGVDNIAGNWHNGCETQVEVSTGVKKTFAELGAVPWVRCMCL